MDRDAMPATRESWPHLQPLPDQRSPLVLQRTFTEDEYERLAFGFIPQVREDKWFIVLEEDVLYFYRSWTGSCVYLLSLQRDGETYTVVDVVVNRDPNQYTGTDDGYDESLVMFLIDSLLLGERSQFPRPAGLPLGIAAELYQQHVVGRGQVKKGAPERRRKWRWLWRWLTGR